MYGGQELQDNAVNPLLLRIQAENLSAILGKKEILDISFLEGYLYM